jgi:hypothetical protein
MKEKNREYSRRNRRRKKVYVKELEDKVTNLEYKISKLNNTISGYLQFELTAHRLKRKILGITRIQIRHFLENF